MNKTAVTWLYDEIKHIIPNVFLGKFEQAKEIEKQQIIDAWENGAYEIIDALENGAYGGGQFTNTFDSAEQYYEETFKQNNNGGSN